MLEYPIKADNISGEWKGDSYEYQLSLLYDKDIGVEGGTGGGRGADHCALFTDGG